MSSQVGAIVSGVLITVVSMITVGGFNMYTDMELIKSRTQLLEISVKDRQESLDRFTAMMHQMDKNLAVQTEAVNVLKDAVKRLEDTTQKKENK